MPAISRYYYLPEHPAGSPIFHGGIVHQDAERLFRQHGLLPLDPGYHTDSGLKARFRRAARMIRLAMALPRGSVILFQWPLHATLNRLLVRALRRLRPDVRIWCLLVDVNGLRDGDPGLLQQEIRFFRQVDFFIVHNDAMERWLRRHHAPVQVEQLHFFDYCASPAQQERHCSTEICFAGNLAKSGFLRELASYPDLSFHLYGEGYAPEVSPPNVFLKGRFPPAELPGRLEGSFGLIWDGESSETLSGPLGAYTRFNSPHKLSLYILAGLPVVCAEGSAAADLVEHYGIGFCVPSLSALPRRLAAISPAAYRAMRASLRTLAPGIAAGHRLGSIIEAIKANTPGAV